MMDCSAGVADRLSLRPVFPAIQRVAVYETRTRLYVVGSTNDGKSCRVLKIDRTVAPNMGLAIEEDEKEYQQEEIQATLVMLEGGNQTAFNRRSGLVQVASAFGIVGFIRFLEGYYIILITKRKAVATIGGHVIYKVEDTVMHPVLAPSTKPSHPDEARYLRIFQNVDLSSNFYFSYSYDLTHSLQCQMRTNPGPAPPSCRKFIWNDHMLEHFEGHVHHRWIIHIIYGFISQFNISVYGRPIFLTIIARRSQQFAGTRFLKRGVNDEGHVANEVETEQIVHDAGTSLHSSGRYTSYLQLRGSVPAFWSQDITNMRPKPQITIDRATPFASPASKHFVSCLKRFGSPIICLNLVKSREKRLHESLLTSELEAAILYLNQFLPPQHHIQYTHKDMARIHKRNRDLITVLEDVAEQSIRQTGIFHSRSELYCHKLNAHPNYSKLGGYGYCEGYIGRDQTGMVRVNCVDCLDRTNTAQFIMGKCALGYQLYCLGVIDTPHVPFDCDTIRLLEEAYEDHGDILAVQYGGSSLVHRIQGYRKVAPMKSHGRDIYNTTLRYYRNAFTDNDKQNAINVFLGVFIPDEEQPNIWDLPTDYYLHHTQARVPSNPHSSASHTKWWKDRLLASLPLPQLEVEDEDDSQLDGAPVIADSAVVVPSLSRQHMDSFDEVYKTYELTDFDLLLSRSIGRTSADSSYCDENPFVVRNKLVKKGVSSSKGAERVTSGGIPRPSAASDELEDDEELDTDDDDDQPSLSSSYLAPPLNESGSSSVGVAAEMPNTKQFYGFELKEPSNKDRKMYERYARMHQLSSTLSGRGHHDQLLWLPTSSYGTDSVFSITPPTVSAESLRIYEQSVRTGQHGPSDPSDSSMAAYRHYADTNNSQQQEDIMCAV